MCLSVAGGAGASLQPGGALMERSIGANCDALCCFASTNSPVDLVAL